MPFKTFTPAVLTSADVNDYLMKQAVITCTSGTRPASPINGMTIYETDTECYATYSGSAWWRRLGGVWLAYTPTITGVTVGNGSLTGRWAMTGKTVTGTLMFTAGSTSSYSGTFDFTLPTAAASWYSGDYMPIGHGAVHNGTGATRRLTQLVWNTSTTARMFLETTSGFVTSAAPFTFGTAAVITANFTYEKA